MSVCNQKYDIRTVSVFIYKTLFMIEFNSLRFFKRSRKINLYLLKNYDQVLAVVEERIQQNPDYLYTDSSFPPSEEILVRNDSMDKVIWRRPHVSWLL